jgi:hypothetical protein
MEAGGWRLEAVSAPFARNTFLFFDLKIATIDTWK